MVDYIVSPPVSAGGTEDARQSASAGRRSKRVTNLTEQQRLERFCEWRQMAACRGIGDGHKEILSGSVDEASAEREVEALRLEARHRSKRAEFDFWSQLQDLVIPPGTTFVPFVATKTYNAAGCARYPIQEAGRRWFRALSELNDIESAISRPARRNLLWRDILGKVRRIQTGLRSADAAWERYVGIYREAQSPTGARMLGPDAPADCIAAWVAAQIGGAHLAPLLARAGNTTNTSRAGKPGEELARELLFTALTLQPESLPVPAFNALPTTVAKVVRDMHSDVADQLNRLQPAALLHLSNTQRSPLDPQTALLKAETTAIVREHLDALPQRQRLAVELRGQGCSRREISAQMGCGEESVKTHLRRADERLRRELVQEEGLGAG